jgi:hypothetical protein
MGTTEMKTYQEWLEEYHREYGSVGDYSYHEDPEAAWNACAAEYEKDGPEDSLHEQGGVRRKMTWKESSEMLKSCADNLGKELSRTREEWKKDKRKLALATEALKKYADHSNWALFDEMGCYKKKGDGIFYLDKSSGGILTDSGDIARDALEKLSAQ